MNCLQRAVHLSSLLHVPSAPYLTCIHACWKCITFSQLKHAVWSICQAVLWCKLPDSTTTSHERCKHMLSCSSHVVRLRNAKLVRHTRRLMKGVHEKPGSSCRQVHMRASVGQRMTSKEIIKSKACWLATSTKPAARALARLRESQPTSSLLVLVWSRCISMVLRQGSPGPSS